MPKVILHMMPVETTQHEIDLTAQDAAVMKEYVQAHEAFLAGVTGYDPLFREQSVRRENASRAMDLMAQRHLRPGFRYHDLQYEPEDFK